MGILTEMAADIKKYIQEKQKQAELKRKVEHVRRYGVKLADAMPERSKEPMQLVFVADEPPLILDDGRECTPSAPGEVYWLIKDDATRMFSIGHWGAANFSDPLLGRFALLPFCPSLNETSTEGDLVEEVEKLLSNARIGR